VNIHIILYIVSLYMFRTLPASIIRSTKNCSSSHWYMSWVGMMKHVEDDIIELSQRLSSKDIQGR